MLDDLAEKSVHRFFGRESLLQATQAVTRRMFQIMPQGARKQFCLSPKAL
jgi:hypothetical protein